MGVISKWIVLVWDGTDLSNRPYVTKIILEICSNYFLGCKPKMLVRFFNKKLLNEMIYKLVKFIS